MESEQRKLAGGGDHDRISALPDVIIHNILRRLDAPEQAARTSALSRRWLHLWRSYPVVEFRDEGLCLRGAGHKSFSLFAAALPSRLSLYYENCKAPLDSFRLSLQRARQDYSVSEEDIAAMITSAMGSADYGSPLEVAIGTSWGYPLPEGLFSNCSRTKVLKLEGCELNNRPGTGTVSLHNLQVLHLYNVQITEAILCDFVAYAQNLESLSVERCLGLFMLEVSIFSFPKLKTLEARDCCLGMCKLNIESPSAAPNLRALEISVPKGFTQSRLDDLISKLPSLETLHLVMINYRGGEMSKLRVSSDRLRVFRLDDRGLKWKEPAQELEIDAPNLVSVQYIGDGIRFPGKIDVVNAQSDCRFVVEGYNNLLDMTESAYEWFLGLRQSLQAFSRYHLVLRLHNLDLFEQSSSNFTCAECSSSPAHPKIVQNDDPPLIVQHLQLEISSSSELADEGNCATFFDGLFLACRPEFICITEPNAYPRFAKFMYEQFKNRDVAICCVGAKCWRHELKNVKIKNAIHDSSARMTEFSKNEVSFVVNQTKVLFMLTWR